MALDADKDKAAAQEAAAKEAAEKAKAAAASAQDAHADDDDAMTAEKFDQAKYKKAMDRKRELNAKLIKAEADKAEADKKIAAFEAEKEAKRVADLSETERLKEVARKAEEKAAAAEANQAKTLRLAEVKLAGVGAEYVDILEQQLAAAQKADPKLDASAWLTDRKARAPALFTAAVPENAGGGPARSGTTDVELEEARTAYEKATGTDKVWKLRTLRALEKARAAKA